MLKNKQNIATLIFAKRWFGRFNNLPVTTLIEKEPHSRLTKNWKGQEVPYVWTV